MPEDELSHNINREIEVCSIEIDLANGFFFDDAYRVRFEIDADLFALRQLKFS